MRDANFIALYVFLVKIPSSAARVSLPRADLKQIRSTIACVLKAIPLHVRSAKRMNARLTLAMAFAIQSASVPQARLFAEMLFQRIARPS